MAELWHYGAAGTQIPERLRTMLRDLDAAPRPENRPPIQAWLDRVTEE